jgi:4-hydroxybenzoate polyprenyltransferase
MNQRQTIPLCVDLDGTLTKADLSVESFVAAIRRAPWLVAAVPVWLLAGKQRLKAELARRTQPDISVLPYNEDVLKLVSSARESGRKTILVTGSNQKFAEQVQSHLKLFDEVVASDSKVNLTGRRKAAVLNDLCGKEGYEYIANGFVDMPVWESAAAAVTVNAPRSLVTRVAGLGKPHVDIATKRPSLAHWVKALRLYQWAKNMLLFVPLVTGHRIFDLDAIGAALVAFLSFGLCASATYILNDIFDLDADRHHRTKKRRPFAAGDLSIQSGIAMSAIMLTGGIALALFLPLGFQLALLGYVASTLAYSFVLKKVASLDVLILAGLYTLRIIAGAFAVGLPLSFWLLAFSMFMFLCLALVKRVAELMEISDDALSEASRGRLKGRQYRKTDIPILQNLGAASGYLAVLVLALYINSPEVALLYATPEILWLIAPLMLLWVTRLWVVTTRGYMDQDPVVFAIKDPETWFVAMVTGAILLAATLLDA